MVSTVISEELLDVVAVVLSVGVGVVARLAMRREKDRKAWKNDWAVGLDLLIASSVLVVTKSTEDFIAINQPGIAEPVRQGLNNEMVMRMGLLLSITCGVFILATLTRMLGWRAKGKLDFVWAINVPNLIGIGVLWYVSNKL